MNLSLVVSPGGMRINTVLSLRVKVTLLPAEVVTTTSRVSALSSMTVPRTLKGVIARSLLACANRGFDRSVNAHSKNKRRAEAFDFGFNIVTNESPYFFRKVSG